MIKIIKLCKVYREYDENYAVLTENYDFYDIIRISLQGFVIVFTL